MSRDSPHWLAPTSLEEALRLRADLGDEATVVAGGTFVGILMNQGFLAPTTLLSLRNVPGLEFVTANGERGGVLRIGAMTTHRAVEQSEVVQQGWPALVRAFSLVASPRVRNQATVGGVLADADYASDPPAMLTALRARAVARSLEGVREIPIDELIAGYYETSLRPDELLVEVKVPADTARAVYRKFRSRSSEDRPCVAIAAAVRRSGDLRVVVGAVSHCPQYFPEICALAGKQPTDPSTAAEIGRQYAEAIEPISDSRGSAAYRRRVVAVEVRRAVEQLAMSDER
jgi:carbon-monoxide dehydrogenase medium subunit